MEIREIDGVSAELIESRGWVLGIEDAKVPGDKPQALRLVLGDLLREIHDLREQLHENGIVDRDDEE